MFFSKIITTCFGIGYLQKGAGTVAALFCCVLWFYTKTNPVNIWEELLVIVAIFLLGVYTAKAVEKEWGKDSNRVVIDEVQGMFTALFLVPVSWKYFLIAFVLFRVFDIAKPLYLRRLEAFPGGWGVMMDDLLAGIYTNVLLQLFIKSHLCQ